MTVIQRLEFFVTQAYATTRNCHVRLFATQCRRGHTPVQKTGALGSVSETMPHGKACGELLANQAGNAGHLSTPLPSLVISFVF
jgi:hypothetical protein